MKKKKNKTVEEQIADRLEVCKCSDCEIKFRCHTTKHVSADPMLQAYYEAQILAGLSEEEAALALANMLERAFMQKNSPQWTYTTPSWPHSTTWGTSNSANFDSIDCNSITTDSAGTITDTDAAAFEKALYHLSKMKGK
jgi:hypothetical protein